MTPHASQQRLRTPRIMNDARLGFPRGALRCLTVARKRPAMATELPSASPLLLSALEQPRQARRAKTQEVPRQCKAVAVAYQPRPQYRLLRKSRRRFRFRATPRHGPVCATVERRRFRHATSFNTHRGFGPGRLQRYLSTGRINSRFHSADETLSKSRAQ